MLAGALASAAPNLRFGTELAPQYRLLNQEGFTEANDIVDVFGQAYAHLEWGFADKWMFEVKPELRAVASRGVGEGEPEGVSVKTSRRVLNSRRTVWYSEEGETYFDFDRLNLRYTFAEQGEAFVGRKPISLGVLRFFPVWNKLTLPIIFQPGPEWVENPDVLGASIQIDKMSYRGFWARGDRPKADDIALAEYRYFGDGVELQAIGGYWWQHTAAGLAGAYDFRGSTLRAETLYISRFRDEVSQYQVGLGIERALNEKFTFIGESLYQSAGLRDTQNVTSTPNRFMPLASKFYVLPYLTYQLSTLWSLQAGFLANLSYDTSYVGLGGFEYSLSDKTSLTFKLKLPFGSEKGEFGDHRIDVPLANRNMGMSSTAILILQSTF
jgi:hypothetical protein